MPKLHCSFCGKSEDEVSKLAAGPGGIHICDECVAVCQVIMPGDGAGPSRSFDLAGWPQARLLALLAPLNATSQAHQKHVRTVVQTLRARNVSWSVIAMNLGVSRQTAWERFTP